MKYNALEKASELRHGALIQYLESTIRRYESLLEFMDDKLTLAGAEIVRLKAELSDTSQHIGMDWAKPGDDRTDTLEIKPDTSHLHNDEQNNLT